MKKWRVSWLEGSRFIYRYYDTLKSALKKRVDVGFSNSRLYVLTPTFNNIFPKGRYCIISGCDCFMGFKKGAIFNRYLKDEGFTSFEDVLNFVKELENQRFQNNKGGF